MSRCPSPPCSPPIHARRSADFDVLGGLESLATTGLKTAFLCPPNMRVSRRAWRPLHTRVLARRRITTSSDVMPVWRATRLTALCTQEKTSFCVQPPRQEATMPTLLDHLRQLKAQAEEPPTQEPSAQSHTHATPLGHLIQPIQAWLDAMTPQQRQRRFTIHEVVSLAHLRGITRPRPPDRDVAKALRAIGFHPCRDWTRAGRNTRHWTLTGETT